MTLKLSATDTLCIEWQISVTKPNFKEAVLGLIPNLYFPDYFLPFMISNESSKNAHLYNSA